MGSVVQMKGFGSALVSRTKRLMAALRSPTDRKTPRMSRLLVSLAKKVSTALSQDAEVGVKADELLMAVSFHVLPDDGATVAAGSGGLPGLRVLSLRP